ncbi:large neutral amino acids transporter small subunit 1-like [Mizuhopecten yessoensis]|uniref:Large neutral amino acids transporter small subunit 2 n=1 Tax=Mizuhopecten yessoensis TaxID=6573 RepID=A0A210PIM9_MIZYE|nr:large neutral amino acids transporter small subunit 1-like [Mizuhopecten yessoensis]OWF36347.1 Large neutral amino acids transporter small subunit 2 [Mizuhopecten yessoensis]
MNRRKTGNVFSTDKSGDNPVQGVGFYARENPAFSPDAITDIEFAKTGDDDAVSGSSTKSASDSNSSGVYSIDDNQKNSNKNKSTTKDNKDEKKDGGTPKVAMKRSLTLFHCVAIMVAVTGHSSVFISPSNILRSAGSVGASLVVWLIGGLINMMLALCFAELGTMLPHAGGPYAYVMHTFGPLPGFLIMWGYVVLVAGPFWAFLAYTAALYIVQPVYPDCEAPDSAVKLLAGWIMITMVILNCVYMKYVIKVQSLLASTKIIALAIIVVAGIIQLAKGETENFQNLFEGTSKEPGEFGLAILYSVFSYGGWQVMTSMMEEVKQPGRDLPRSVYITFIVVIIKYIMTNVAYFTLLSPSEVLGSQAVALLFIRRVYSPISAVISALVATTSIGALNASIMGHSRLLFAGSRVGHMPVILGMISHKYLTPWPSILVLLTWGLVMLYTGGVVDMMDFIGLYSTIMGIAVVISLLYLRYRKPDENRPYQTMTFVPLVMLVVNIAVLVLAIYQKPQKMGIGLGILFAGIPLFWFGVLWEPKPKCFREFIGGWTVVAQKMFMIGKTTS